MACASSGLSSSRAVGGQIRRRQDVVVAVLRAVGKNRVLIGIDPIDDGLRQFRLEFEPGQQALQHLKLSFVQAALARLGLIGILGLRLGRRGLFSLILSGILSVRLLRSILLRAIRRWVVAGWIVPSVVFGVGGLRLG